MGEAGQISADYVVEDFEIVDFGAQMTVVRLRNGVTGQDGASGASEDEPLFRGVTAKVAGIGQYNADLFERALFLPKPFSLKQLVGQVQKALESS